MCSAGFGTTTRFTKMIIYIYQLSDTEYGAGIGYEACKLKGRIVEQWPVNTPEQAAYVVKRGSAFNGVSPKLTHIAEAARQLMIEDETFIGAMNKQPLVVPSEIITHEPSIWERICDWLGLKSLVA